MAPPYGHSSFLPWRITGIFKATSSLRLQRTCLARLLKQMGIT